MRSTRFTRAAILLASLAFVATSVQALTDQAIFRDLQYTPNEPGARTLGLGGASVATVRDSTATEINPAALPLIDRFEFLGELRISDSSPSSGGQSMGSGDVGSPEFPFVSFDATTTPDSNGNFSFVGLALPFRIAKAKATASFSIYSGWNYTGRLEDASLRFALEDFPIWINPSSSSGGPALEQYSVVSTSTGALDAELINSSVGLAATVVPDLSVGLTAVVSRLTMRSSVLDTIEDPLGYLERPVNPRADANGDGFPDAIQTLSTIDDDDTDLTYTLGVHYRPDSLFRNGTSPVSFGLVYRKGARLSVEQNFVPIDPLTGQPERDPVTQQPLVARVDNTFNVPDEWALGIAGRPGPGWVLALDFERIEYSDMVGGFQSGQTMLTNGMMDPDVMQQNGSSGSASFEADDATVVHLGAEYSFDSGAWSFGFRGGYFNEPDGRVRMTGFDSDSAAIDQAVVGALESREDQDHFTAGFSLRAPIDLYLNVAADFADVANRYLLSGMWRFGKQRR